MANKKMGLVEVIQALRTDLASAVYEGIGEDLQFDVEGIEVELKTEIHRGSEAGANISFMVSKLGIKGKSNDIDGHVVRLKLKPKLNGEPLSFNKEVDDENL